MGKSSWFRKRRNRAKEDKYGGQQKGRGAKDKREEGEKNTTPTPTSVLFVEQTPGGELASRLRELFVRLVPTVGFYVKVVERTGRKLQDMFPLTNLWGGQPCGREGDCVTCYQGAESIPDCTAQSIHYENICSSCVPGARSKKQITREDLEKVGAAAVYVGETSRSINERSREHWQGYKGPKKEDNHM